jgi:hypothetical protein
MNGLRNLAAAQPAITNVRGQGLMIGFDFAAGDSAASAKAANAFMFACRRRGVHLTYGYGNVNFRIIPPLVISRSEIDFALEVIEKAAGDALANTRLANESMPRNPHTRRLFEKHPWKRLVNYWWRSSPEDWVEKSRMVLGKHSGRTGDD